MLYAYILLTLRWLHKFQLAASFLSDAYWDMEEISDTMEYLSTALRKTLERIEPSTSNLIEFLEPISEIENT